MRGILLSLLFTHQAWAGIFCHCALESESQHSCYQTAHHSSSAGADTDIRHSTPCSDEGDVTRRSMEGRAARRRILLLRVAAG